MQGLQTGGIKQAGVHTVAVVDVKGMAIEPKAPRKAEPENLTAIHSQTQTEGNQI